MGQLEELDRLTRRRAELERHLAEVDAQLGEPSSGCPRCAAHAAQARRVTRAPRRHDGSALARFALRTTGVIAAGLVMGIVGGAATSLSLTRVEPLQPSPSPPRVHRGPPIARPVTPVPVHALRSTPEASAPPAPIAPPEVEDRRVRWIAPQVWEVDRSLVDELLQVYAHRTGLRFIPHEEGGRAVGVEVYGVRRASMAGRLGLQNGDLIRDVNGVPVADLPHASRYPPLRATDALFVRLVRRGEPRLHVYRIR